MQLSPDFRRWWDKPASGEYSRGIAEIGEGTTPTRFEHEMLTVDEHRHLRMVVYFPRRLSPVV